MSTNNKSEEAKATPLVVGSISALGTAVVLPVSSRKIESDETGGLPGPKVPTVVLDMTKPIDDTLDIDKDTVVYLVYLLYKTNMIARNNLRNIIDQISKPLPDNVLKWLVNEAAKAGR